MRKAVFWLHLIAGVVAGLVILVMSVTGVLLAYERQITAWADRSYRSAPPAEGAPLLSVGALLGKLREAEPKATPSGVTVRSDSAAPVAINFGRERTVFMNPYTGAVLGEGATEVRSFFRFIVGWHRWLAASGESRTTGKAITGACNLAFLVLVVTGVYLWWPRSWRRNAVKAVAVPSLRLKGKARDFNWHNAIGLWSAPALFFIVLTGVIISYPWASDLLYRVTGNEPPPRSAQGRGGPGGPQREGRGRQGGGEAKPLLTAGLDNLWSRAEQQVSGWQSIQLRLPEKPAEPVAFTIDKGNGARPDLRSQLTLDAKTGEVVQHETYESYNLGRQLRFWSRWVHTGEAGGLIGQTIAALASLGGAILVWTGIALTWRRFINRGRKSPSGDVSSERSSASTPATEATVEAL